MARITVDTNTCKGCGLCVSVCPQKIITLDAAHLNAKGFSAAYCTDYSKCTGCAMCARMCPDVCITVER